MPKGYTKRRQTRHPYASQRGRIIKFGDYGRIIMTIERTNADGSTTEIQHHATKGIRVRRGPKRHLEPGVVRA